MSLRCIRVLQLVVLRGVVVRILLPDKGDNAMVEADARLVKPGEPDKRSGWFRFWVRVSRLAAPVQ